MKNLVLAGLIVLLLAGGAFASPLATGGWTDYEYYQSGSTTYSGSGPSYPGQFLSQGDTKHFFFDLKNANNTAANPLFPSGTDSALSLENDVDGYTVPAGLKPLTKAWASVSLFSVDTQWDQFSLEVKAFYNEIEYDLATTISDVTGNTNIGTYTYNFTNGLLDAWRNDPLGLVELTLTSVAPDTFGYNDFNLLEVGVGASPVPEPGTLLLLGVGLIGLAYLKRRKEA